MPTYLKAFQLARETNPNLTIEEFELLGRSPKTADLVAEVVELDGDGKVASVTLPNIPIPNPVAVFEIPAEDEIDEDEDEGDDPIGAAWVEEYNAQIIDSTEFRSMDFWNHSNEQIEAYVQVDKPDLPLESKTVITLNLRSSTPQDVTEWYKQIHGLEISLRWNMKKADFPFTFNLLKRSKSCSVSFLLPSGVTHLPYDVKRVSRVVKPYLRADFGVIGAKTKTEADPLRNLIPFEESWSARNSRIKKKLLGGIADRLNESLKR